jgi:hypothetical protein
MAELITKVAQAPNIAGPGSSGPHTSSGNPSSAGVSRSWYQKGGKDHKRLSSHGRNALAGEAGSGKMNSRADGVTSPDPIKNYSAWVSGGDHSRRDVERQQRYPRGTHFEDEEDEIDHGQNEAHEMGFIDFVKGGGRRVDEGVIVKTMETIVTTKDVDGSGSVTPSITNTVMGEASRGTSETGSTNELKPSR